jgi:hypothetical protein
MTAQQLDLFGAVQTEIDWTAQFEQDRVEVVIDQELQGFAKGSTTRAWKCPDCGELELTPFSLAINHGYDPYVRPYGRSIEQGCIRRRHIPIEKPFHRAAEDAP